jgi:hypothetical protein
MNNQYYIAWFMALMYLVVTYVETFLIVKNNRHTIYHAVIKTINHINKNVI